MERWQVACLTLKSQELGLIAHIDDLVLLVEDFTKVVGKFITLRICTATLQSRLDLAKFSNTLSQCDSIA